LIFDIVIINQFMPYSISIRQRTPYRFIGSCPSVPEAQGEGRTFGDCLANTREAVERCLEERKKCRQEIPEEDPAPQVILVYS
jgi:predicted RNase H-like HicB family nuclease